MGLGDWPAAPVLPAGARAPCRGAAWDWPTGRGQRSEEDAAWEPGSGTLGGLAWPLGRLGAVAEDEKKFRYGSTHLPTHFSDTAIVRNEVN